MKETVYETFSAAETHALGKKIGETARPGEAKEADIGIAGGIGEGLIIKHGEVYKKVPESELLESLRYELLHWNEN